MEQWNTPETSYELEERIRLTTSQLKTLQHSAKSAEVNLEVLKDNLAKAIEFEKLKADPVSYIRAIIAAELARVEIENEFLASMQDAAPVDTGKDRGVTLEGLRNAFGYSATFTTDEIDGDRS